MSSISPESNGLQGYTDVACPSCGTTLRGEDMSLQTMAGRCRTCDALVDLRAAAPAGGAYGAAPAPIPVPLPAGVHVEERGRDLVITRRWFSWMYVFLLFFCVVWNGMLAFFYGLIFFAGGPLVMKLFPLLHVAVGVGLTYATAAGLLNRTTFTVERDHLAVRHGPLPWRGNRDLSAREMEQLFCSEVVIHGRNGTTVRYGVDAVLKDGRHLKLATGLNAREQALFIEQAIEKHLGIVDRRVRSEMAR